MRIARHISEVIGNTPLVQLNSVVPPGSGRVVAKVEYLNPGLSSKDRIAVKMIDAAEASGELKPGGTIVEPTSGNTGVGLALVAQHRGYHCVFVCPDKVSEDKRNVLRAYGAEVVVCPTAVPPDHPDSYYSVSDRLVSEIDGAWKPDQYSNPQGPASHYETTGPEIWADTDGQVTHFVAGIGTGGTITGAGRYLKDVSGGTVRVVGADPEGSVYSGGTGRPYLVEGVGEDFWPSAYDPAVPDQIIAVTDSDSFNMTRRLAREEAMLVGGSCGMAVVAALKVAEEAGPDALVVVLLPDGGRGYLSKIFNDAWMSSYGFLRTRLDGSIEQPTVGDVLRGKSGQLPDLVHTHPSETVRDAIGILREYGVSQMPVVGAEPPVMAGEVAGSVSERELLSAVFEGRANLADAVGHAHEPAAADHRRRRTGRLAGQDAARLGRRDGRRGRQTGWRHHPVRLVGFPVRRRATKVAGPVSGKLLRVANHCAKGKPFMTEQPPSSSFPPPPIPGSGNYPPPPPPSGGYVPPPPGPVLRGLTKEDCTPWLSRVAAYLIDHLPLLLILGVGWLVLQNSAESACLTDISPNAVDQICTIGYSTLGMAVMWGAVLVGLAYFVWNYGYRQGTTGSSIGKSLLKFKVVSENTGKPIGFGLSVLRQIAHVVDAVILHIGYLFPLWTAKRQTLADKMMATVCLPLDDR